jgi:RNA-directed DNA polymerase
VIVRHADDFVIGFQREADARAMLSELGERLAVFGLTLHEQKTRLIEFGRFAATSRSHRGERRPATFAFLGFTHYCGWTRARQVHRKAEDAEQAPDAQAEGAAPRRRGG